MAVGTTQDILDAIGQLAPVELDQVARHIKRVRMIRPKSDTLQREAQLLKIIRQQRPPELRHRYRELLRKLESETLTPEEREELMPLIDQAEAFAVHRLEALVELANLRKTSLPELMQELGIKPQRV